MNRTATATATPRRRRRPTLPHHRRRRLPARHRPALRPGRRGRAVGRHPGPRRRRARRAAATPRPPCSPAAASGACRACSSTSRASPTPSRATAAARRSTAQYETVSDGNTGHAESVQVTFDPAQVSYGKLLQVYFSVAHNPTELNFQGPDHGTQYRSAVFPLDDGQRKVATAYIAQLEAAKAFGKPIVTKVEPFKGFYPGRGPPPELPDAEPRLPVHRLQRPAQGGRPEEGVPGPVRGQAGAGAQRRRLEVRRGQKAARSPPRMAESDPQRLQPCFPSSCAISILAASRHRVGRARHGT